MGHLERAIEAHQTLQHVALTLRSAAVKSLAPWLTPQTRPSYAKKWIMSLQRRGSICH